MVASRDKTICVAATYNHIMLAHEWVAKMETHLNGYHHLSCGSVVVKFEWSQSRSTFQVIPMIQSFAFLLLLVLGSEHLVLAELST